MTRRKTIELACTATMALTLAACITTPYDGENVAPNPTTVIPEISGWGTAAGQNVTIFAKNSSGGFDAVTSTTTASTGWVWDGTTWYSWQINGYNLPLAYWTDKPGGCGRRATLKAKVGSYFGASVDQPFLDCWDFSQTTSEFLEACQSSNSPDVNIDTCGALCC